MEELFYSQKDKRLFYIAGYSDNSYKVEEIISTLQRQRDYFLEEINFPKNTIVQTERIIESSIYKGMRYYWINDVKVKDVPKKAFRLGKDYWTMDKWIKK